MTMNDTWGFKRDDHHWKSAEMLVRNIIDIASKGGNYLLNVGPTAEGEIPAASLERLHAIGQWMQANGESIYGTQASPFEATPWGRSHRKTVGGNTRLYLHVFNWPTDGKLLVPHLKSPVGQAYLLAGHTPLTAAATPGGVTVTLPAEMPDKLATVVVLETAGPAVIEKADPYADETPAQRDARMKWWREARFGLFIHWGVYSVPAGFYHGQAVNGIGEWIMNRGKIPVAEYRAFAKQFNPVKFDADQWVRIAKEAGMKYIVITSKHHDGFAMFDSQASKCIIVEPRPLAATRWRNWRRPASSTASSWASITRRPRIGTIPAGRPPAATGTRPRTATWTSTSARSPPRRSAKSSAITARSRCCGGTRPST